MFYLSNSTIPASNSSNIYLPRNVHPPNCDLRFQEPTSRRQVYNIFIIYCLFINVRHAVTHAYPKIIWEYIAWWNSCGSCNILQYLSLNTRHHQTSPDSGSARLLAFHNGSCLPSLLPGTFLNFLGLSFWENFMIFHVLFWSWLRNALWSFHVLGNSEHQWTTSPAFERSSNCLGNLQRRSNCEQQGGASRILSHFNPSLGSLGHHPFPSLTANSTRPALWILMPYQVLHDVFMMCRCTWMRLCQFSAEMQCWAP